jgi:hypothetical protein
VFECLPTGKVEFGAGQAGSECFVGRRLFFFYKHPTFYSIQVSRINLEGADIQNAECEEKAENEGWKKQNMKI